MKKLIHCWLFLCTMLCCCRVTAQEADSTTSRGWSHNLQANAYFMKDQFIFLPIYAVNKDWLHLEARYNYEDLKTFSAWFGYNFSGGNKLQYTITPMVGGLLGNIKGIAPGLEFDLGFKRFGLYSESEYVIDLQGGKENNFYYNWTDLTFAPKDWIWFGLSSQRTRLYQTDLDIQRGLLIGGGKNWYELSGYLYNLGFDDPFFILSLSITLP